MGLLRELFQREDRPGPGVSPDEPRKKGLRRLWEVCTRDLAGFFWAGLIALLGTSLWIFLTGWAMVGRALAAVALAGAVGGLLVLAGLTPHLLAQLVLFAQPLGRSVKNSFLLLAACLPRSLGAAAILLGYAALTALFPPFSYLLLILANFWLSLAAALLAIYKPMEQILDLERQIQKVQEARRTK